MTHVHTFTEPTAALRDWHRTDSRFTDEVGERIYAEGLPKPRVLPAVTMHRQGGTLDGPIDNGIYRYDVWAEKASDSARIAMAIVSALMSTGPTDIGDDLIFKGSTPTSPAYFPDPEQSGIHRHTFVAQVTCVQNL